ncbi:MAG: Eco47II family restriction endonuclease [Velocimicrobium sp.]
MNTYLEFIDDEKLMKAIEALYGTYQKSFSAKTLPELNKNIMDPFKFQFDTVFLNQGNAAVTMNREIFRQSDKSISNAIGLFHQQLIGCIEGFCETKDLPCDVKKCDNTIFAEIKNKHNTMNVRSAAGVYEELEGLAKSYPKAICYLVEIIAKKSTNEVWEQTVNEKKISHPRIRRISADRFFELATGEKDAFRQLCEVLPIATKDFLEQNKRGNELSSAENSEAYLTLSQMAKQDETDVLKEMFAIAFNTYHAY